MAEAPIKKPYQSRRVRAATVGATSILVMLSQMDPYQFQTLVADLTKHVETLFNSVRDGSGALLALYAAFQGLSSLFAPDGAKIQWRKPEEPT